MEKTPPSFDRLVGGLIRQRREELGWTQRDAAMVCRALGLPDWSRDTQASVETGRRALALDEALLLAEVLGLGLINLLDFTEPETIGRGRGRSTLVDVARARNVVTRHEPTPAEDLLLANPVFQPEERRTIAAVVARDLAEERFDLSSQAVEELAEARWGRSFGDEFLARLDERVREGSTLRQVAAFRASVIRSLYAEMAEFAEERRKQLLEEWTRGGSHREDEGRALPGAVADAEW